MSPEDTPGRETWRPERETKAQRQWRPGQQKTDRSVFVLFTSTVLLCEAFVIAFFGTVWAHNFVLKAVAGALGMVVYLFIYHSQLKSAIVLGKEVLGKYLKK